MIPFANGVTVTLVQISGQQFDGYGDPVADVEVRTTVAGCGLAPLPGTGVIERGREGVVELLTLMMPAGTPVDHVNRVEIADDVYTVEGQPAAWTSPISGWSPGVVLTIRRALG